MQEYFHNDDDRLQIVLGSAFFDSTAMEDGLFETLPDSLDPDARAVRLRELEDDEMFLDALQRITIGAIGTVGS